MLLSTTWEMGPLILLLLFTIFPFFTLIHAQNDTESALFHLPSGTNVTTVRILDDYGERNISYYESNGYAIVDGDIAYGTVAELLAHVVPPNNSNNTNLLQRSFPRRSLDSRAHSIFPNGPKWPNANVVYKYDSVETENKVSGFIDEGISRWKAKNPFLQFTKVSPPGPNSVAGVVTVTATECGGCYASVIGYSSSNNLVLNLQQSCGLENLGCFNNEATHELGHVLGLVHEVKRPDFNQHVVFHCENLIDYFSPSCCIPATCCGLACQFTADNSFDHSGDYRVTSIMQYRADAFAAKGKITLEGIWPDVVPNFNPSFPDTVDHERICKVYSQQCNGVCGNGIVEPSNGEQCDDGNSNNSDSCSNTCKKVSVCGNGILEPGEECDDGNLIDGDGCTSKCKKQVCGNGILEPGEECDDGNLIDGDGCTSKCKTDPLCITCNPISGLNHCDITTSCITTPSGNHHCACRAGYKANALDSQIALHYRLSFPGQEYRVFVAPGVACDTLCDNPFGAPDDICTEIQLLPQAQCN